MQIPHERIVVVDRMRIDAAGDRHIGDVREHVPDPVDPVLQCDPLTGIGEHQDAQPFAGRGRRSEQQVVAGMGWMELPDHQPVSGVLMLR